MATERLEKPTTGPRGPKGHRMGWWHQKAKAPDELVLAVLADYKQGVRGRGYASVGKKHGLSMWTVRDWVTFNTRGTA